MGRPGDGPGAGGDPAPGWLSKVRIFEGWCENGDRLLQVVKVQGRPLALAQAAARALDPVRSAGAGRRHGYYDHRSKHEQLPVPMVWLREQLSAGVSKRVMTQAIRLEMGTQPPRRLDHYTMRQEPAD